MNDERLISLLSAQTAALARIANALEAIALTNAPAPNFIKPIAAYADFDFTSIGALVKGRDANGPTELEWGGYLWTRRSPQNKFGEAIWFSRPTGKDAEGNVKYIRLITFKKLTEAEPLPRKVEALVEPAASKNGVTYPVREEKIVTTTATPKESELDKFLGPRQHANEHLDDKRPADKLPSTETEFYAWQKEHHLNGQETYRALGADAKTWLKKHPEMTWADVARQVKAAQGKDKAS